MLRSFSFLKRTVSTPVSALTTVDLPWATWPIVPTLKQIQIKYHLPSMKINWSRIKRFLFIYSRLKFKCLFISSTSGNYDPVKIIKFSHILPTFMVACRLITSGDNGVNLVMSKFSKVCLSNLLAGAADVSGLFIFSF